MDDISPRHPTAAAIAALAARFHLPNTPDMQDWEYEVADPARLPEFLAAYRASQLNEDERFVLMMTLIQSVEEAGDLEAGWRDLEPLLRAEWVLHAPTVGYWCCFDEAVPSNWFKLAGRMRALWAELAGGARYLR